jgi:hypothetical protein
MPRGFRIRNSKIAKEAIRRLVKKHQKVFDGLAKGRTENGTDPET